MSTSSSGEKPLPYEVASCQPGWEGVCSTALMLKGQVDKFGLNLKLDDITPGKGNCFFIAVIQQLRRPEIYPTVSRSLQQMAGAWDHLALRKAVCSYAKSSAEVAARKEFFLYSMNGVPWDTYWGPDHMMRSFVWVDAAAVQVSAWFLGMDLLILSNSSNHQSPLTRICSSYDDIVDGARKEILIGARTDSHYQSLLPKDSLSATASQPSSSRKPLDNRKLPVKTAQAPNPDCFKTFPPLSPAKIQQKPPNDSAKTSLGVTPVGDQDSKRSPQADSDSTLPTQCPACKGDFPQLMRHLRSKACALQVGEERIAELRELFKKRTAKKYDKSEKGAARQAAYDKTEKGAAREATRNKSEKGAARQADYRQKIREEDYSATKKKENERKAVQRAIKRKANDDKIDKLVKRVKKMKLVTEEDRRLDFQKATLLSADFVCVCCQNHYFKESVILVTEKLLDRLEEKGMPQEMWMADARVYSKVKVEKASAKVPHSVKMSPEYEMDRYICSTCYNSYLSKRKMPPICAMNNLQLHETDKELKAQDLQLTELEGALCAKNIIFQKIVLLRKSRWTGLTDQIVNIPIPDESINELITQLPRVPNEAEMVVAVLKRRLDYDNHHTKQLIKPDRMYRLLVKLIQAGNPHYTQVDTPEAYKERCAATDQAGYQLIYGEVDDEVAEALETMSDLPQDSLITDEILGGDDTEAPPVLDLDDEDNEAARESHPLRKHQFIYKGSVAYTDKFLEVSVAPGQGQRPKGILADKDLDIKAFPHLYNADGSNGKDQDRPVKLFPQRFFIQRALNKEKRFSRCAPWLYYAVAYLEQERIFRNICAVGTRGNKKVTQDGGICFELDDPYRVVEGVPNSPRYWLTAKFELLAKLYNFGPFHVFLTLSCADLRWPANFASILLEKGYSINIEVITNEEGEMVYQYEARSGDGEWKPLEQFIKEDVEESYHELIRGNVLTATRYFHQRVTQFLKTIVLAKSAPLKVKYYAYKVEFQDRGAGHVHSVLWLDTEQLEKMVLTPDGDLVDGAEQDLYSDEPLDTPLAGVSQPFKKMHRREPLDADDLRVLTTLIDLFTTCSVHPPTVGEEVARIALEVNTHRHTATCTKGGRSQCRFHYPRCPAPHSIVCQALPDSLSKKEKKDTLERYETIICRVKSFCDDPDRVKEVMDAHSKDLETTPELHQAGLEARIQMMCKEIDVDYKDYISALSCCQVGYSVVLRRDLDEVYVNSFNREFIRAWDGNMDMQFVLDPFAVSTYVVDYVSKDDTAVARKMKEAIKNDKNLSLQQQMTKMGNFYVQFRQIGEAEAWYRLLPSLKLQNSNVDVMFVSTNLKNERSSRFRKATQKDIESGVECVELEGHEGLWFEINDMWSKYLRRPAILKHLCFAQFAKIYKSYSSKKAKTEDDADLEERDGSSDILTELVDVMTDGNPEKEDDNIFHYAMTYLDNGTQGQKLPKFIELKNPKPGEVKMMTLRTRPIAIRFNQVRQRTEPERYMAKELMLYCPLTEELEDDKVQDLFLEEHDGKSKVAIVKAQVMPHLESVEEARHYVAEAVKELDLTHVGETLDAEALKDNLEVLDEIDEHGVEDHPDYEHCIPGDGEFQEDTGQVRDNGSVFKPVVMPPPEDLRKRLRRLDPYQRQVVDIAVTYCKDLVKSRKPGNKIPKPPLLMVHGGAGAGKSTVIEAIHLLANQILRQPGDNPDLPVCLKMAHTGCAAVNIGGYTLTSLLGFSYTCKLQSMNDKKRDRKRAECQHLKIVIVDEVSMVSKSQNELLSFRLGEITNKRHLPYGGLAVFFFGDLCQLKPIKGKWIFDTSMSQGDEMGGSELSPLWNLFDTLTLEVNHRQGDDKPYADMLNRIRTAQHTPEDLLPLYEKIRQPGHPDLEKADLWISGKKAPVCVRNKKALEQLPGQAVVLKATHACPTEKVFKPRISEVDGTVADTGFPNELSLKLGAKVMLMHNIDVGDRLVNGQIGALVDYVWTKAGRVDKLVIKLKDPQAGADHRSKFPMLEQQYPDCVFIGRCNHQYHLSRKSGEVGTAASVIMFPVVVAFCLTCHKIQGQSIIHPATVAMDLDSCWGGGMAYVMLSRIQRISQLFINGNFDPKKIRANDRAVMAKENLEAKSINRNPTPWYSQKPALRIATLNCAGLSAHYQDLQVDHNLLKADVIHLSETSLLSQDSDQFPLPGFEVTHCSVARGKGVSTYYRAQMSEKVLRLETFKGNNFQVSKLELEEMDSISIYRSSDGSIPDTLAALQQMISVDRPTLISGDFNLCYRTDATNTLTSQLLLDGFEQLVTEATQIMGRVIDHVYWRDSSSEARFQWPTVERSSPYYSDHDTLMVTLVHK